MNDLQKIIDVLSELRAASIAMAENHFDEAYCTSIMQKYNIMFLGHNLNTIGSAELLHALHSKFNVAIDRLHLNELLPSACSLLDMTLVPEHPLTNLEEVHSYSITLY